MAQKVNSNQLSKDYIQTVLSSNMSVTGTSATVPLGTTAFSSGTKLTRSGNTVVIGTGVTRVKVSYTIMADGASTASYLFARIRNNTTEVSQSLNGFTSGFGSCSEVKMLNVTAGDALSMWIDSGSATASVSTGRMSFMLVEVIE